MTAQFLWPAAVHASQMLSTLTWLAVSHHYFPAALRILRRRSTSGLDGMGCWAWAMGMVQIGMTVRWLLLGGIQVHAMDQLSLELWVPLWILNSVVAIGILHTWRDEDYGAALIRARAGLLMWVGVAVLCAAATFWIA